MAQWQCRACGSTLAIEPPIPRDAECPQCGHDIRCCLNCRHYDPAYNNACRETEADPVADKHRRNFCEYFEPSRAAGQKPGERSREAEARARLEQMFGGGKQPGPETVRPAGSTPADEARRKLRELFGDPGPKPEGS